MIYVVYWLHCQRGWINCLLEITSFKCFVTDTTCKIRKGSACSIKYVCYVGYCVSCRKLGVGSNVCCKPHLHDCKSKIQHNQQTSKTVWHLIEKRKGLHSLRIMFIEVLNHTKNFQIKLQKETFCIVTRWLLSTKD